MKNTQKVLTGLVNVVFVVIASILIGSEYGLKIGTAVGLLAWSLLPLIEKK